MIGRTRPRGPRRVLVVSQHYWPEPFRVTDICDFLVEQGCEVDVLCGMPNYPSGHFYEGYGYRTRRRQIRNGVRILRAPEIPRGNNSMPRIFLNYVSFPFLSLSRVPTLLRRDYDHVLLYQTSPVMMSLPGIIIGKLKGIELTMYSLDLWPENLYSVWDIRNRFARWLLARVSHWHYRRVDKIAVPTEAMREHLIDVTGIEAGRTAIVPQACEKVYEERAGDELLRARFEGRFNVVFTGNLSPAQSPETMVRAARELKRRGYGDIHWIIVGEGMSREPFEAAVAEAGLREEFTFEGRKPVSDMPLYTDVADLLVGCLAKSDLLFAAVPAKVTSYIASGKPIVLAMDGEVADLINDTIGCGFVGPSEDAAALADNIESVYLMSPEGRAELGRRAESFHFAHLERNLVLRRLYGFMFD